MTAFTNIMFGRDSRRIQGPLESQPIALFSKPKDKNQALHSLIDEEQSRIDGRRLDEIRPLYLRTGRPRISRLFPLVAYHRLLPKYSFLKMLYYTGINF